MQIFGYEKLKAIDFYALKDIRPQMACCLDKDIRPQMSLATNKYASPKHI